MNSFDSTPHGALRVADLCFPKAQLQAAQLQAMRARGVRVTLNESCGDERGADRPSEAQVKR